MTESVTIRGTVRGTNYEAQLKHRQLVDAPLEQTGEWQIMATGLPTFAISASPPLLSEINARAVIEMELERRLAR